MAEILGANSIAALALPTGLDGERIAQWQLRDGTTWQQFVASYAQALAGFNSEIVGQWGWTFGVTEEMFMEYPQGGSVNEAQDITDLDVPDMVGGETLGHMLPLRVYGVGVGGTRRYFRDARAAKVSADLRTQVLRLRWRFEKKLLTRLFTNTENAIGSAGYDVPFVRGTGGAVDFAPPAYGGEAFTTSHDHFLAIDSDNDGFDDAIEAWVETLVEHGHMAPFDLLVSKADVDAGSYHTLTKFVELKSNVIQVIDRAAATTGAQFFANGQADLSGLIGYYQSRYGQVNLRASARIPSGYGGGGKSYGANDPRNPLAVRVHPDVGFGARLVLETTDDSQYPIKRVTAEMEYGIGVGMDRTNGAVFYRHSSGSWANPTIS
jgi:hypothetical protein